MTDLATGLGDWLAEFTLVHAYAMGLTVLLTLLGLLLLRTLVPRLLANLSRRFGLGLDTEPVRRITGLLTWVVVVVGVWALVREMPVPDRLEQQFDTILRKITVVLLTIIAAFVVLRMTNEAARRYAARLREASDPRAVYVSAVRKIANVVLVLLAALLVLSELDYKIGPLLASLGVAGIAVALALQDTLGNLFAGFYLTFDQPVRTGDYIVLDTGEEGFVESIGWRSTRIRPWADTLIILPNSKLAEATITNWHLPSPERAVYVSCGVSYGSDLDHVERVCIEEATRLMAEMEEADHSWEPVVRFNEFGDSNIKFRVVLRTTDPAAMYRMQHEYTKALHRRFRQEGIEISWPVRKVVFAQGTSEGDSTRQAPS